MIFNEIPYIGKMFLGVPEETKTNILPCKLDIRWLRNTQVSTDRLDSTPQF